MQTYLFYDIESTDLNKSFGQVVQFFAIRTDLEFKEIERKEIFVEIRPDVIPSPAATITHRISLEQCQQGLNEVEATQQIHQMLNKPGTISIGYNSLGFDDEFLRFSFYRNLLPPYTHQFANGCGRMDLYPMAIMYYLYKPETLQWPYKNDKISLKLEDINRENNLAQGQAHNAAVDVEATVNLAKLLAKNQKMWDYLSAYFDKKQDHERILSLPKTFRCDGHSYQEALLIEGKFGSAQNFQAPALYLGEHWHYRNQHLWLRLDLEELQQTTLENVTETTWVIHKKLAEPGFVLPQSERFLKHMSPETQATLDANRKWLKDQPAILNAIKEHYLNYKYPFIENVDLDSALYQRGFLSTEEQKICQQFHAAAPQKKRNIAEKFTDPDNLQLAKRILARNFPETLSDEEQTEFQSYIDRLSSNQEIIDYRGHAHLLPNNAIEEIQRLRETVNLDGRQQSLLTELEEYLQAHFL